MINIYTNKKVLPKGKKYVELSDIYFNLKVSKLDPTEIEIVKDIEDIEYLGDNGIRTPYGIGSIFDISTGSKTVINVLRNPDIIFNINRCGSNALNVLFSLIGDGGISVYLDHIEYESDEGNKNLTYIVNDKIIVGPGEDLTDIIYNEEYI